MVYLYGSGMLVWKPHYSNGKSLKSGPVFVNFFLKVMQKYQLILYTWHLQGGWSSQNTRDPSAPRADCGTLTRGMEPTHARRLSPSKGTERAAGHSQGKVPWGFWSVSQTSAKFTRFLLLLPQCGTDWHHSERNSIAYLLFRVQTLWIANMFFFSCLEGIFFFCIS